MRLSVALAATLLVATPSFAMHHGKHSAHSMHQNDAAVMAHHASLTLGIGDRPAALHVTLMNKTTNTKRLVAAESSAFARMELHTHEKSDGMMRMVQVDGYDVPAKGKLEMSHGGDHLMGFGFTGQAGDMVTVTLRFADGATLDFTVEAKARKKHGGKMGGHHHGH